MRSRCYLEISLENFRYNVQQLIKYLGDKSEIIGIIKANYYGHGDIQLANVMKQEGVRNFAVASLDEAIKLRSLGLNDSLMILGYTEVKDLPLVSRYDVIITLACYQQVKQLNEYCQANRCRIKVEVKVDTGMSRIGIPYDLDDEKLKEIYDNKNFIISGTFSHLATADSLEKTHQENTLKQKENFDYLLNRVRALNLSTGRTHLCASSGILNYPDFKYDYVRPGFVLLGFDVGQTNHPFNRKTVMSWYSKVEMVKEIEQGQGVSYGHTYHSDSKRKIATISVGYGDGYPRRLSNKGYVMINGQKANIVGRICMDQMMVDVTDLNVQPEDTVVLAGEGISFNELAQMADTIVDEIVCDINDRVGRVYIN